MNPVFAVVRPAPAILVMPPFGPLDRNCLGLHLLQGCSRKAGVELSVFYANIHFAATLGESAYQHLANTPTSMLAGERLFARAAFNTPPMGHDRGAHLEEEVDQIRQNLLRAGMDASRIRFDPELLLRMETTAHRWVNDVAGEIAAERPAIVGCSTTFQQTNAAIALLSAVKRHSPGTVTLLGGANCEGEMAEGLAAVAPGIDHFFEGESEAVFTAFLQEWKAGRRGAARVVHGKPVTDMNSLPTPRATEYRTQLKAWLPQSPLHQPGKAFTGYETSRGCWWGEKSHCTFCGLNGGGMAYRAKSPDRVLEELRALLEETPGAPIAMADNIMPHTYFKTLLPRLAVELPQAVVFYEEKSNVNLERMRLLARARVEEIQFGIESLSTPLLQFMGKGVKASANLATLRYAAAFGIRVQWNLLFGFPGDQEIWYRDMLQLMRLIHHLPPPSMATPVLVSRFSPYQTAPASYGIRALRPLPAYADVFPIDAPTHRIAYHFFGDYATASRSCPELGAELHRSVITWRRLWQRGPGGRPSLRVIHNRGRLRLVDTRGLEGQPSGYSLEEEQAASLLTPTAWEPEQRWHAWALEHKMGLHLDGRFVPLATASPDLLAHLENPRRIPGNLDQVPEEASFLDLF